MHWRWVSSGQGRGRRWGTIFGTAEDVTESLRGKNNERNSAFCGDSSHA